MIYTAWGVEGRANTLIEGEGPPRFSNGEIFDDCEELIWRIEADSWEAASTRYHELQGGEPYVPFPADPKPDAH